MAISHIAVTALALSYSAMTINNNKCVELYPLIGKILQILTNAITFTENATIEWGLTVGSFTGVQHDNSHDESDDNEADGKT